MVLTDNEIIEEVIRLVEEGVSVTLPVNGSSMLPFIIGGKESVILQKPVIVQSQSNPDQSSDWLKVGDVVLAWVDGNRYVVHRIIRIDGDRVTLMGDGNLVGTEHCSLSDVKAIATHVVDSHEQRHDLYTSRRKVGVRLWWLLRPIRRYLLAIYRRV